MECIEKLQRQPRKGGESQPDMYWTLNHIEELKKKGKIRGYSIVGKGQKKKSKYGNEKTEVGGILFDSKREAKRYKELLILLKAGVIGLLERQISYELNEGGTHSLKYIADFRYILCATGETVVEDAKGMRTVVYKKKKRLMKQVWGITIKEV
jgi:hypothetical protein